MEKEFIANFVKDDSYKTSKGNVYWVFSNEVITYVISFLGSQRNRICVEQLLRDGCILNSSLHKTLFESFNQDAIFADEDILIAEAERLMQLCFQEYSEFVSKILMKGGFKCN